MDAGPSFLWGMIALALCLVVFICFGFLLFLCSDKCWAKVPFSICSTLTMILFWVCGSLLLAARYGTEEVLKVACGESSVDLGEYGDTFASYFRDLHSQSTQHFCQDACPCAAEWAGFPSDDYPNTDMENGVPAVQYCLDALEQIIKSSKS